MNTTPTIRQIDIILDQLIKTKDVLLNIKGEFKQINQAEDFKLPPDEITLSKWINQLNHQKKHSTQKFTIMLLGEYNAGKTTFINALLNIPEDKRIPAYDEPTNAIPIRLSYKQENYPDAKWIKTDGAEEIKSWDEVIKEAITQTQNRKDIVEVIIYHEHPLLLDVDFLDMPGTGTSWYKEHTEITRDYIINSELILWVVGANEPSREGLKDYKIAEKAGVPVTLIFNAWGYLDENRNKELFIEQDSIEESVKENFPGLFEQNNGFRIYAKKCLETIEKNGEILEEFGLKNFETYLYQNIIGDFVDKANERRKNVISQVNKIAISVLEVIKKDISKWDYELEKYGSEKESIKIKERSVKSMEFRIRENVRKLSGLTAKKILEFLVEQTEIFLNDNLTIDNFELWKKSYSRTQREALKDELTDLLKNEYLKLNQKNNWMEIYIKDLLEESWTIILSEWQNFLDELQLNPDYEENYNKDFDLPFDEICKQAMKGISALLFKLGGASVVFVILLSIPGGQIIDSIALPILGMLSIFGDPMKKPRDNIIKRFKNEAGCQEIGLKNELSYLIINQFHEKLKEQFKLTVEKEKEIVDKRKQLLDKGKNEINKLSFILQESFN